jgi:DNA mismatch repair protein MutS
MSEGRNWLIQLEAREKEKTGIKNLKVSYNKVFGYSIEVTKSNLNLVPREWIRKQTLTTGERYVTEELKVLEEKILGAEEKLLTLEYNLFLELREKISKQIVRIQSVAGTIAMLDVLCTFATVAEDNNYVCPKVDDSGEINIVNGRHPVIEKMLESGEFIRKRHIYKYRRKQGCHNHWTKHGRKIHIHEAGGTYCSYGTNRLFCSCN